MKNQYQQILSEILEKLLEAQSGEIYVDRGFADLGMDSMTGLRFCRKIEDALGHDIDPVWLYDQPSIRLLAQFLSDRRSEEVAHGSHQQT